MRKTLESWMDGLSSFGKKSDNPFIKLFSAVANLVLATALLAVSVLNLATSIVAAPFKLIGWLFGGRKETAVQQETQPEKDAEKQPQKQEEKQKENQQEKQKDIQKEAQREVQADIKQPEKQAEVKQNAQPKTRRNYDAINAVNAVGGLEVRAAQALGVKQVSRQDLALAVACLMDCRVAGTGNGYTAFDRCGELLDGLMGKPGASIDTNLLKNGLKAAQSKASMEREGMLNNLRHLSRMVNRAPSLSSPRTLAAGALLEEALKVCEQAEHPALQALSPTADMDKLILPNGNHIAGDFKKDLMQIRGTAAMSRAYRMGLRAQADEQWKAEQPDHVISQENARKIASAELLERMQVNSVIEAKQKQFLDNHKGQPLPDISKLPSPDPFDSVYMNDVVEVMGYPDMAEKLLNGVVPELRTTKQLAGKPAREVLAELNRSDRPIAKALEEEMNAMLFPKKASQKQAEKSLEQERKEEKAMEVKSETKNQFRKSAPAMGK